MNKKKEKNRIITKMGFWILLSGLIVGCLYFYPSRWHLSKFIDTFYSNLSVELISVALTVLIIDKVYSKLDLKEQKKNCLYNLCSTDINQTTQALRIAKENNWLNDGSLSGLDFNKTNLSGLDFSDANLEGCIFKEADLQSTIFNNANCKNILFEDSILINSDFRNADLEDAIFKKSNLKGSKFNKSKIKDTDFMGSELRLAKFNEVNLNGAKFEDATLELADLEESHIKKGVFLRTDFKGANLRGTKFERNDLSESKNWENTIDLDPKKFIGNRSQPEELLHLLVKKADEDGDSK